jgi:hypothetical protein
LSQKSLQQIEAPIFEIRNLDKLSLSQQEHSMISDQSQITNPLISIAQILKKPEATLGSEKVCLAKMHQKEQEKAKSV